MSEKYSQQTIVTLDWEDNIKSITLRKGSVVRMVTGKVKMDVFTINKMELIQMTNVIRTDVVCYSATDDKVGLRIEDVMTVREKQ